MELEATELAPDIAAGFGIRFAARAIDSVAGMGAALLGGIPAGLLLTMLDVGGRIPPGWETRAHGAFLSRALWSLVGMFLYHALTEGLGGASLGKLVLGLRVVNDRGAPCDMTAAVVRSSAVLLDGQLLGLVAYLRMRRTSLALRFGDTWAGTVVARARMLPRSSRRPSSVVFLALALGLVSWAICAAVGTIVAGV